MTIVHFVFKKGLVVMMSSTLNRIMLGIIRLNDDLPLLFSSPAEYSGVAEPCFPLKEPPNIPVKRANLSANESQ